MTKLKILFWILIALFGLGSFTKLVLGSQEPISAVWLITAALCIFAIAYRFYSQFIAQKVLILDASKPTPAHTQNDGIDYIPTHGGVLFGHHFAAIAGAGPLVGPILAAQMGYMPGLIWLLVGVVLAGAVQDFIILMGSVKKEGKSLGEMIALEFGVFPGIVAKVGILGIMIILLAVLAMVVVKTLAHSPWGLFTIAATIPIALIMGLYMRWIRPGRVGEASLIGLVLLFLSIYFGQWISLDPTWSQIFTLSEIHLAYAIIAYGIVASILPVWLLLAPRDYLSTFLKIGTIVLLALGILWAQPLLLMPSITIFTNGTGPVFAGDLFPFLFVTIACGAISGFHSLISSGTTPKMLARESHARPIGYGAMLMESCVAIMALVAACALTPGLYFAMNSPAAALGKDVFEAAAKITSWGFVIQPEALQLAAEQMGESTLLSRTGGAATFAVGMANILSQVFGNASLMAFWYHFAILFEALFILTTIDAGTRVGRFMTQEILGWIYAPLKETSNRTGNILGTLICAGAWGWFLIQGVNDPLGGIYTLWPLFGIANQILACVALTYATSFVIKTSGFKYIWVTLLPLFWVMTTTITAAFEKILNSNPKIGFLAAADKFNSAILKGEILAPAKSIEGMKQIVFNQYLDAFCCAALLFIVSTLIVAGLKNWTKLYKERSQS